MASHIVGYPRMGPKRELKFALESFWDGKSTADDLKKVSADLRCDIWKQMSAAGIKYIPSNTFAYYDQVLDTTAMLGAVPPRYGWNSGEIGFDVYFSMARGNASVPAMEMTKWFDTNYHYIVPELGPEVKFSYASHKAVNEYKEAKALGVETVPVLVGPVSYLLLSKLAKGVDKSFDLLSLLPKILPIYNFFSANAEALSSRRSSPRVTNQSVQKAAADLKGSDHRRATEVTARLDAQQKKLNLPILPTTTIGSFPQTVELRRVRREYKAKKISEEDYVKAIKEEIKKVVDIQEDLDIDVLVHGEPERNDMVEYFGEQLSGFAFTANGWVQSYGSRCVKPPIIYGDVSRPKSMTVFWSSTAQSMTKRPMKGMLTGPVTILNWSFVRNDQPRHETCYQIALAIKDEVEDLEKGGIGVIQIDEAALREGLPLRKAEHSFYLDWAVHSFRITNCGVQDSTQRNDMVEYFGEQLSGFAFTANGWVQSYGSRCVKPPIIYGDVSRPKPMTVFWSSTAQSMTKRPMKGMLTGPVTILNWSFVRNDQPRHETCYQIALAIKDEVEDLEKGGIGVIQIDEAALREGLPLRKAEHSFYLDWAVHSFRITNCGVQDSTQIHTHMCYSHFNDIIHSIIDMDADVITIENSRSDEKLLSVFREGVKYGAGIGPGVYDIHSPRIPSTDEIADRVNKMLAVLEQNILWVNPDCGLKTRKYTEVKPALKNMVDAAKLIRSQLSSAK
ncbi:hypothetical protein F2Q69_00002961 [Brassica cretica]|uniref:5-methyltetrahydropteroyltriglutamate--homocysteine S-methyltransferase n=1 Tax=Brassica cretica TaxID=69181 RepID=A0A8S9P3H1_BRACR|nr:hypothetical protein F2Q69_00002961 [Brassica cretica]